MAEKYILTPDQQKLVEENLDLADILLRMKIHPNETIRGMEFEELYQCGCLALCRAAATYDYSTQFRTYASRVVYNAMIDQCRTAQKHYGNTPVMILRSATRRIRIRYSCRLPMLWMKPFWQVS